MDPLQAEVEDEWMNGVGHFSPGQVCHSVAELSATGLITLRLFNVILLLDTHNKNYITIYLGLLESGLQEVQRPLSAVVGLQLPLNVFHPGQRHLQVLLELLQHGGCD